MPRDDPAAASRLVNDVAQPADSYTVDAASVVLIEDGRRYRLPIGAKPQDLGAQPQPAAGTTNLAGYSRPRVCREVATERDLLSVAGTFYELPARNAGGVAKLRPICTHDLAIHDFCSHNGLLLLTGLDADTATDRIIRSADGKAAVWAGVVDDLWQLGKPRGEGGPWRQTAVQAGVPSDPYLMTGYDQKQVTLSADKKTELTLEVDLDGTGLWVPYRSFTVPAGETVQHTFPDGFSAYWIRGVSSQNATVSVSFIYD
ncbi:MAG: hypothetical protein EBZ13_12965 [Planctomycetia bacterium]|nr:hypothetical protein [Planctomycetia bacterium]